MLREIQAGIKVYYFSKFASREYFPILNEYILPSANSFSIGGQPIADLYFNMKVKKMFFFIEGQQIGTLISYNKAYAFPSYPVYDFRLNIGIVVVFVQLNLIRLKTVNKIAFNDIESIPQLVKDFLNQKIEGFEDKTFSFDNFAQQIHQNKTLLAILKEK